MAAAGTHGRWMPLLARLAALLCFGAVLAALIAALGTGTDLWHFRTGFTILRYALFAAAGGTVLALVAAIGGSGRARLLALAALVVGGAFLLYLGNQVRTARSVPAIHDITTNLQDPPAFARIAPRADSLATVKSDRPDLQGLAPAELWRRLHAEAYPDLQTVRVPWPAQETVRRAVQLAEQQGWEVVTADPAAGRMEATATTLFFRFKDDVALRVRPAPGGGSLVDMRSVSRVGVSDVGVNAARIRSFLSNLQPGE